MKVTLRKRKKKRLLPFKKTLMDLKMSTRTNNWTLLKKQHLKLVKFKKRRRIEAKFLVNRKYFSK